MITLNQTKSKIAIVFKDKDISQDTLNTLWEEFITFMNEEVSEMLGSNLFVNPIFRSTASGETSGIIETEDLKEPMFITKKYITDVRNFIKVLAALKKWKNTLDENIHVSIEVLINKLKVPLYLRKDQYVPPDTYYHLNVISEQDDAFIKELNERLNSIVS
jgi:hypothetical protein